MITLDLSNDAEARALFARNLEALRRHDTAIADRLEAIDHPVSKVVEIDGDLNLDIGHTLFYENGVRAFVDEQYAAYLKTPRRIDLQWPGRDVSAPQILTKYAIRQLNIGVEEQGLRRITDPLKQRGVTGFAVTLGVGIGDHVGRLLADHEAQSLIVVEQFIEFLWHSLHLNPWHEWLELLESRRGRVFFIIQDSPASASSELTNALRSDNGGTLDGTLIYTHYRSHLVREIHRGLSDQISYIGSNRGFFEDENIMMMNATHNFLGRDHGIWRARPRREKSCPAFVVAAGPSVDGAIEKIREYKDCAVIISCGSGLKVLLGYGIKPDFHVEVENTFGQAEILERVAGQHDLSDITLVAAATVNPRTAAVFDNVIFFHRDTVSSTHFFEVKRKPIYLAVPTVSNGGVRFAIGMGFKQVYMFGIDFGSRVAEYHHSKQSSYYTDKDFMYSFQGTKESTEFPHKSDGNLGGTVLTSDSFLLSRLFMQKLMNASKGFTVYNCSDGIEIPMTLPKLPETVRIDAQPEDRDRALKVLANEIDREAAGADAPLERFLELRTTAEIWFEKAYRTVDGLTEDDVADPFESYDRIWKLFEVPEGGERDPIEVVVWQSIYGSTMTMFNQWFRMHRRIEDGDEGKLYRLFLTELRAFLETMEQIFISVIDGLTDDVRAVSAETAAAERA